MATRGKGWVDHFREISGSRTLSKREILPTMEKKKQKKLLGIFHHIAIVKCYLCKKYLEVFWDIEHVVQVDQGCLKSFKGSERGTLEQEILGTSPIY